MITRLMVIQKINEVGNADVFQITSENFQWTFETGKSKSFKDKEYFPFTLNGKYNLIKRSLGRETKIIKKENQITFCDDYGVPEGTVIGILFPRNYIPDIIKFKDKPYIPVGFAGHVSSRPSGQIQIFYNHFDKRCAIVFNIHEKIVFGFKCIAIPVSDSKFPHNEHDYDDNIFDISLSRDFLNVEAITNEDLKLINETVNKIDIEDIQKTMNELLIAIKKDQKEKSKTLLNEITNLLINGTSVAGSLTTLADSYNSGGAAHQFIRRIIDYASL
jgi:hypothetical protein